MPLVSASSLVMYGSEFSSSDCECDTLDNTNRCTLTSFDLGLEVKQLNKVDGSFARFGLVLGGHCSHQLGPEQA